MSLWFECKVKYDKMQENGMVKPANETFLVDALSFTEAEARIIKERTPYISGEFNVSAVKKTKISEIFFDESDAADKYYMVKCMFITIDEKTAAEKKTASLMLVQASDIQNALDNFNAGMKDTLSNIEVAEVKETPILDIYPVELS